MKADRECLKMAMAIPLAEAKHFQPGIEAINTEAQQLATKGFPLALNFVHEINVTWKSVANVITGLSVDQLILYCEGFTRFAAVFKREYENIYGFLGKNFTKLLLKF